ncbi:hypothetical protein AB0F72_28815 [Actinoplanes sp. NPDC023936]|uniref:hypothetical protein n=1 Tax=Actinoplanes sp. NPDC023936 TaxID=3154910 RepID=UPI0033D345F1
MATPEPGELICPDPMVMAWADGERERWASRAEALDHGREQPDWALAATSADQRCAIWLPSAAGRSSEDRHWVRPKRARRDRRAAGTGGAYNNPTGEQRITEIWVDDTWSDHWQLARHVPLGAADPAALSELLVELYALDR